MEQYAGFGLPDPWEPEDKYQKREKKRLKKEIADLKERLAKFEKCIPTPQECMEYVSGNPSFTSGCNYMRNEIEKRMKNA